MAHKKILSELAPIETLVQICDERQGKSLSLSDVNMVLPFAKEAKVAVENLSRFTLENINSSDELKKEVAEVIYGRFQWFRRDLNVEDFKGDIPSIGFLNDSIKSVRNYISNTIDICREFIVYVDVTETKKKDDPAQYEERIKQLVIENENLKEQLAQRQSVAGEEDCKALRDEIEKLREEVADMETRKGIDAPKAALLVRIACTNLGGMPSNRENAWPLISNLWGSAESISRRRLKEGVKEDTVEGLAKQFDEVSPKIAGIIRKEGKKIIESQKIVK